MMRKATGFLPFFVALAAAFAAAAPAEPAEEIAAAKTAEAVSRACYLAQGFCDASRGILGQTSEQSFQFHGEVSPSWDPAQAPVGGRIWKLVQVPPEWVEAANILPTATP